MVFCCCFYKRVMAWGHYFRALERIHTCLWLHASAGEMRPWPDFALLSLSFMAMFLFLAVSFPWEDHPTRWKWVSFQPSRYEGGSEGNHCHSETRIYRCVNQFTKALLYWWRYVVTEWLLMTKCLIQFKTFKNFRRKFILWFVFSGTGCITKKWSKLCCMDTHN